MTCFWTDLVATTQFCEAPAVGGQFLSVAISDGDVSFIVTTDTADAPASFTGALSALLAAPQVAVSGVGDVLLNPFVAKRTNPALAGFLATSGPMRGASITAPRTRTESVYVNATVVADEVQSENTVASGTLSVTEAFLVYFQGSGGGSPVYHGANYASLPTSRFTVGVTAPSVLTVDYTGGSHPATGDFTLLGSADSLDPVDGTPYVATVIRVVGTLTTGTSSALSVDCYLAGFAELGL